MMETVNYTDSPLTDHGAPEVESPLTKGGYLATGIYLTILGILASMGNLTIISTVIRSKPLKGKPQVLLLLNVAIADLGISVSGYPYASISGYTGRWMFGYVGCQCYAFVCFFLSMGSMDTLVVISVVRYIVIVKPKYRGYLTNRNILLAIAGCWVYALVWTVPPLIGWSHYTYEPFGTSCSMNWQGHSVGDITYTWATIIFCYLVHIIVLIYCYSKIVHHAVSRMTMASNGLMRKRLRREIRVSLMCFIMVGCFFTVWTPYALISMVHSFGVAMPTWLLTFPTMFAKSSCMLNPIIYSILNARFRGLICKFWCRCLVSSISPLPYQPTRVAQQHFADPNIFKVQVNKEGIYTGQSTADANCWIDLDDRPRKDRTPSKEPLSSAKQGDSVSSVCLSIVPGSSGVSPKDISLRASCDTQGDAMQSSAQKSSAQFDKPLHTEAKSAGTTAPIDTPSGSAISSITSDKTSRLEGEELLNPRRKGKRRLRRIASSQEISEISQEGSVEGGPGEAQGLAEVVLSPRKLRGKVRRTLQTVLSPSGRRQKAYLSDQQAVDPLRCQSGANQYSRHMISEVLTGRQASYCDDLFHDICHASCSMHNDDTSEAFEMKVL